MKRLAVVALVATALTLQNCGSAFKKDSTPYKLPCQEIVNNKKYLRGEGEWTQLNPGQASKVAVRQARIDLANSMKIAVTQVTKDFTKDIQISGEVELDQKIEDMGITVVDEIVTNSYVVCKEVVKLKRKNKDGKTLYTAYAAVQIDKKELVDGIVEAISDEEELRLDVQAEMFEEKFDKALEDYRNRQK